MITIPGDTYRILVFCSPDALEANNDNVDIEVVFDTGQRYVATLFTPENIKTVMNRHKRTGECNFGTYLSVPDMVIIETLTQAAIQELVRYLVETDELAGTFMQIEEE